jgi:NO-binding membrane sensor protein with MHYT domain
MFGQFFISGSQIPANALTAESYDTPLVLLSYLIASLTAYATILVFHQIVPRDSKSRTRGTFFAAAILGAGIWLTHFLGTIALKTPISQTAGGSFTALSVLAAVLLSWLAVHTTLRGGFTARCILLTALILGIATSLPDYLKREAMLIDGQARYRPGLFALSLFIPVAGAATTLNTAALFW